MSIIIPATIDDIDALASLEQQLFSCDRISRRQFRYLLTRANAVTVKVDEDGSLAGYITLLARRNSLALRIYSIAVSPLFQQRGFGNTLLCWAEEYAASKGYTMLTLEVSPANKAALGLYRRAGFVQRGLKQAYYQDGSDALVLSKPIQSPRTRQ